MSITVNKVDKNIGEKEKNEMKFIKILVNQSSEAMDIESFPFGIKVVMKRPPMDKKIAIQGRYATINENVSQTENNIYGNLYSLLGNAASFVETLYMEDETGTETFNGKKYKIVETPEEAKNDFIDSLHYFCSDVLYPSFDIDGVFTFVLDVLNVRNEWLHGESLESADIKK